MRAKTLADKIAEIEAFLSTLHPYDGLPPEKLTEVAGEMSEIEVGSGDLIYGIGQALDGVYLIVSGQVEVRDRVGSLISLLRERNSLGERGLLDNGKAVTEAVAASDARLLMLPTKTFHALIDEYPVFDRFFNKRRPSEPARRTIASVPVSELMSRDLARAAPNDSVASVARIMRDRNVSSVLVLDGGSLAGIVTNRDLTNRVLAEGLAFDTPISAVMTTEPLALSPNALGSEVLHTMLERGISHLPVVKSGEVVGILTQTDLTHYQALTSASLIKNVAEAEDVETLARAVSGIPELLVQLVSAGNSHAITTRLITDVGDAATRRLIDFAEAELGPPPIPYLWLACGSQGRQEQSGVSDQDNCLFLDDAMQPAHEPYFAELAKFVSDGLSACGYYYCPGDMMATNPTWRQPVRVWREYFADWIATPNPMAQMLASVMFDLRPISGASELFDSVMAETLGKASANSIFVAHMISNALKHTPPLNLFGGLAMIRSGEHKDMLDLKLSGVVPIVDLARIYSLQGKLEITNTRARLLAAQEARIISKTGARDLIDAYDLIAETRLRHQVSLVRGGDKPSNFMPPGDLSELERSHLRNAFVVVKTMQSSLGHGRAVLQ